MEKESNIKEFFKQLVIALVIQIVIYGISYIGAYFIREKVNITVCASTKINNDYYTSINIKNYQDDKSIEKIVIWNYCDIDVNSITYDDYEIDGDKILIKNISPGYNGQFSVYSSQEINQNNIKFECEEERTVDFLHNKKQDFNYYWKDILPSATISVFLYAITLYLSKIITDSSRKRILGEYDKIKFELNEAKNEAEKEKEIKNELKNSIARIKIIWIRKLNDYAKELDFYRMLIKESYTDKNNNINITESITKALKTYKTMDKVNISEIELDNLQLTNEEAKIINEKMDLN